MSASPSFRRHIGRQAIPRSTAGLGLVELMVVVTIISMMMAVAMPSYQRVQRKARAASLVNDFRVFTAVLQARTHEAGSWPDETAAGVVPPLITKDDIQIASWTHPAAIGGQFDWENNQVHGGVRYRAALALVDTAAVPLLEDLALYQEIDASLDDGNLTTGSFRLGQDNCLLYIIEP